MTKETTTTDTLCDSCSCKLVRRSIYTNNGAYQNDFVTLGKIDLCFLCAGQIFDINIVKSLEEDVLKTYIRDLQISTSSNPLMKREFDKIDFAKIYQDNDKLK